MYVAIDATRDGYSVIRLEPIALTSFTFTVAHKHLEPLEHPFPCLRASQLLFKLISGIGTDGGRAEHQHERKEHELHYPNQVARHLSSIRQLSQTIHFHNWLLVSFGCSVILIVMDHKRWRSQSR